jgi:hypothetical protein
LPFEKESLKSKSYVNTILRLLIIYFFPAGERPTGKKKLVDLAAIYNQPGSRLVLPFLALREKAKRKIIFALSVTLPRRSPAPGGTKAGLR